MSHSPETWQKFLTGIQGIFLDDLYKIFLINPQAIDASWHPFFQSLQEKEEMIHGDVLPSSQHLKILREQSQKDLSGHEDSLRDAYRTWGHLKATVDPLGLTPPLESLATVASLPFPESLPESVKALESLYCGPLGFEFMHIQDRAQRLWFQERIESRPENFGLVSQDRLRIQDLLMRAETYERFLHKKYPGAKRFGLEGGESLIPALEALITQASLLGMEEVLFGMPHRGRLTVLTLLIGKPFSEVFYEFQGDAALAEGVRGSGDVKYHLGISSDRTVEGHPIHLSLTPNPSHLEAVDPVLMGKVRAKQTLKGDTQRAKVMGILIHGDAAFAGQGVVSETFLLSNLPGYTTGGTIHIIVNNQIGFTTAPWEGRSSPYCSDAAKVNQCPVIHVNGDCPEAVVYAAQMAMDFRHTFKKDVVIDLVCYRRQGHNEMDEPAFTQPVMYKVIKSHASTYHSYTQALITEGLLTAEQADNRKKQWEDMLQTEMDKGAPRPTKKPDWLQGNWTNVEASVAEETIFPTGIALETLQKIGAALTTVPQEFRINPKLERGLKDKKSMIQEQAPVDWGTAEALALGSLLEEGYGVRLSGQDCGRGTFSQRHCVWVDQETGDLHIPLNHIQETQGFLEVINSPLSEEAVLGFEYGYSVADSQKLVLWEAQFGDFANGAQVIIDQFIMAGEAKWFRFSGLTLLLPHGFEGQGAEHSSARLERYLQMCADANAQVVNCTTPANYFHVLRRQLKRPLRKPLILATPKSLLRHPGALSPLRTLGPGTHFMPVLGEFDPVIKQTPPTRILLCSGKVFYDLVEKRHALGRTDVHLVRLEQLYPFPHASLKTILKGKENALVFWCQEEAQNNGAWSFVDRRLEKVLQELNYTVPRPFYVGRPESASPATGYHKKHETEQETLLNEAFQKPIEK